jgi:DNA-binding CsgD family transcriptional regulator
MYRSEVVANLMEPLKLLFCLMQNGVLKTILAAAPRTQLIEHKQQNRLSALEMEMLAHRYNQIKSMRLVAREFGISETTVRSHLRALGITVRISKSMTELQKQKARDMWAAGMPSTLIGKKLGYSHHTILRTVRNSEYEPIVDKAQADGP